MPSHFSLLRKVGDLWSKSLRVRLIGSFLALSVLAVTSMGMSAYFYARESLKQAVFQSLSVAANLKEDQLSRWIDAMRNDVLMVAEQPDVHQAALALLATDASTLSADAAYPSLSAALRRVLRNRPDFKEIMVLSAEGGKILVSTQGAHEGDYRINDSYFVYGRQNTYVQNVYVWPVTLEPTMTIATPLVDQSGKVCGVLAVHLNLDRLDQIILQQTGLGETGETYLVDRYNVFVAAKRFNRQDFPRGVHTEGIDAALQGKNGQGVYLNYASLPVVGVYRWIDYLDLALLVEIQQSEAFAPARQLGWIIIGIGLMVAALSCMWVYILAERIARPIGRITATALQITNGNLDQMVPVTSQDEVGVLALTFNRMTDQLRTLYAALHRSEQHFRKLIENGSDIMLVLSSDGDVTYASPSIKRVLGYLPEEWLEKPIQEFIHPDDMARLSIELARFVQQGVSSAILDVRALHRNGEWRVFEVIGSNLIEDPVVAGVVVNTRDITDRLQAEAVLRQYTQRLEVMRQVDQSILQAKSPQAIAKAVLAHIQALIPCQRVSVVTFDLEAGEARLLAERVENDTHLGDGQQSLIDTGELEKLQQGQMVIIQNLAELAEHDISVLVDDTPVIALGAGRKKLLDEGIFSVLKAPLISQNSLIGSLNFGAYEPHVFHEEHVEIVRELADVLAVAIQQARLLEQVQRHAVDLEKRVIERTNELEAKNREMETFTYSVSHDLKAPLRGIDGYSKLLLDDYGDRLDEDGKEFLMTIRKATGQMHQLISDLLAYSRLERRTLNTSQIDLPSLVQSIVAERQGEINERDVLLTIDIPCQRVSAEVEGLSQALRNLLDNALKFTQNIATPSIEIGGQETETSCILWVRDNGIGFDMRYHDRIYDIFQRLHRTEDYPGTGIGLALVRKVMQRMGGRTWAESSPGAGAAFYLEIPK